MTWELLHADCRQVMSNMGDETVDAVVCDPPYHLTSIVKRFGPGQAPQQHGRDGAHARLSRGFMGKTWDGGDIAFDPSLWAEVLRVLKPGGHVVAFSGTRTYHRMACAIEDAGFEIRDMLEWLYGSGFPKGGLDEQGRGGALKPAHEPMCLGRKSFRGSALACVAEHGTALLNIDACRIPATGEVREAVERGGFANSYEASKTNWGAGDKYEPVAAGRFPANICHDGSPEVVECFPAQSGGGDGRPARQTEGSHWSIGAARDGGAGGATYLDGGSAARFFYCAKASKRDRDEGLEHLPLRPAAAMAGNLVDGQRLGGDGRPISVPQRANVHPTVKPTPLMQWLVRLVTPPGGLVFDPFTGSGSTGKAAMLEGRRFIGAEMTDEYIPIARARIAWGAAEYARLTSGSN